MSSVSFDPRVVMKSRKAHKCYACAYNMPQGSIYISYPGVWEDGKFKSLKLCVECSFLLHFKTGEHKEFVREGEFTERRIPNFLKKKRAEFRKNPQKAIRDNKLAEILRDKYDNQAHPAVSRLVVKTAEFDRHIYTVSAGKYSIESFPKGGTLTICAGVSGAQRTARIKGVWEVDGTPFNIKGRRIAVLLEREI